MTYNYSAQIKEVSEAGYKSFLALIFPDGTVTDNGDGSFTITTGGGNGGGGEANTASNVGIAGVGLFKQKTGVNLEFKKINAGSNKITITDDTGNSEVDIDVDQANLTLAQSQITNLTSDLAGKQDTLVSGTNIKTINSTSLLGSGDIAISGSVADGDKGDITVSSSGTVWTIDTPTVATVATDDKVLIKDTSNSDVTRYVTAQSLANLSIEGFRNSVYGSGNDGDVTISSSVTLTRTMHYNNLTISSGAVLTSGYYIIYVRNNLDISASPTASIKVADGTNGNNATTATGGSQPTNQTGFEVGAGARGGAGGTGTTGAGVQGVVGVAGLNGVGGTECNSNASGAGGLGSGGAGGASRPGLASTGRMKQNIVNDFLSGVTLLTGGCSGGGGGAGGGDGANTGGGGGSGGNGGGILAIFARQITRGGSTGAYTFTIVAGNGGSCTRSPIGNIGNGGGGAAGAGGCLYLVYEELLGSTATNAIRVNGGNGGNGGNGSGTGIGGNGGSGGNAGVAILINSLTGITAIYTGTTGSAGTTASGTTGGTGGAGGILEINL